MFVNQSKWVAVAWKFHGMDLLYFWNKQPDAAGMLEVGDEE